LKFFEKKRSIICKFVYVFLCRKLLFSGKGNADQTDVDGAFNVARLKLFGKIPPNLPTEQGPYSVSHDYKNTRSLDAGKPESEFSAKLMKNSALVGGQVSRRSDKEVPSTTALILEHRPE